MNFSDWMGIAGVGLILAAYFLSTLKLLSSDSNLYFIINAIGAGLACYASYLINYWPFVILEGVWSVVSIIGLLKENE
ncbi:MAG TPA: hypothetical protein VEZ55_09950 [Chitinophagaceae bacterium]|jgi:hypothetical protein|nr:hypothetical protein [Chitinophagaceae bacterium]